MARVALLAPAGIALLAGLDAALMLLDLPAPVRVDRLPEVHGMLMVLGFVGTLIAVERAVAVRRPGGFAAPGLLSLGAVVLLSPAPLVVGQCLLTAGAAVLVGLYQPLWRRQRDEAVLVQALGTVLALGAAVLWLGGAAVPMLAPWLVGFVVLTLAGQRLDLARIAMGPPLAAGWYSSRPAWSPRWWPRRCGPSRVCSVLVAAGGAAAGVRPLTALGIAGYVAGPLLTAPAFLDVLRRKPPTEFPAWSVLTGLT